MSGCGEIGRHIPPKGGTPHGMYLNNSLIEIKAGVVKLVDIPDLGSGAVRHGGSSPSTRTKPIVLRLPRALKLGVAQGGELRLGCHF